MAKRFRLHRPGFALAMMGGRRFSDDTIAEIRKRADVDVSDHDIDMILSALEDAGVFKKSAIKEI